MKTNISSFIILLITTILLNFQIHACNKPTAVSTSGNIAVCPGEDVSISGSFVDGGNTIENDFMYYVWYQSGINIQQADFVQITSTIPDLIFNDVSATNSGTWILRVQDGNDPNSLCFAEAMVDLILFDEPIFAQDLSAIPVELCRNEDLNLEVQAFGTNLIYEWQKNAVNIPGANSESFDKTVVDNPTDGGTYSVTVIGTCGQITSAPVDVTVYEDLAITTDLNSTLLTLCPGDALNLEIMATGTGVQPFGDLQYSWIAPNGVTSTSNSLNIPNVVTASSGDYSVQVTGACGSFLSNITQVQVDPVTEILNQPVDVDVCINGGNASFEVIATGSNLTYQWQVDGFTLSDGINVTGSNTSSLMINPATLFDAGSYQVMVQGICGNLSSVSVDLTVIDSETPSVNLIVNKEVACGNEDLLFTAIGSATGTNPTYEFREAGNPSNVLQSASSNPMFITNASSSLSPLNLEVVMTSNASCISSGAMNPVTDSKQVSFESIPDVDADISSLNIIYTEYDAPNIFLSGSHNGESASWVTVNAPLGTGLGEINILDVNDLNTQVTLESVGYYEIALVSNNGPCEARDTVAIDALMTGIDQVISLGNQSSFFVEGLENYDDVKLTIYNLEGKLIAQVQLNDQTTWDASSLPVGLYIYKLSYDNNAQHLSGKINAIE